MGLFKQIEQYFCNHWPVERFGITKHKKTGIINIVGWECLKCKKDLGVTIKKVRNIG